MRRNRIISLTLAVILLLFITAASAYAAYEADHECCGVGCPVCAAIEACAGTLHLLCLAAAFFLPVLLLYQSSVRRAGFPSERVYRNTPVTLKVLLLN